MKTIKDMSVIELKALSYDLLARIEQNQAQLRELSQLIAQKLREPKKPTPKAKDPKPKTNK